VRVTVAATARSRTSDDPVTVVALAGELDLAAAPALAHMLTELMRDGAADVILDLSEVEFMDGAGLGLLVNAHDDGAKFGRRLAVVNCGRQVRRLLAVVEAERLLADGEERRVG
ncbi:MAG TPA: STAS domain-containing protein, partial [Solirubrobacteraceae bacterium]|nr:STAS domain-containing protein [Solirubrobacteraceae bacterium]